LAKRARVLRLPGPSARAHWHGGQDPHGPHHQTRRRVPAHAALHGARAVIAQSKNKPQWLQELLLRRPPNVAAVALANKMARIAWAMVAHGRDYDADWISVKPCRAF